MKIEIFENKDEVQKIAVVVDCKDGANWKFKYVSKDVKKHYSKKDSWVYFLVMDKVIMKVGGTGMDLVSRANFYQNANKWSDKAGYCNAATNPIIWYYLNQGRCIELYAIKNSLPKATFTRSIMGEEITFEINPDFRPIEGYFRKYIESYNKNNNIKDEELLWDGKPLQHTMVNLGLKEVNVKSNKRIPKGVKVVNNQLVSSNPNCIFHRGKLIPLK